MIYYISGKISDDTHELKLKNLALFNTVEKELLEKGYKVFNPAKLETEGMTWEHYLANDLKWIYENRPTLYLLHNWQESKGALLEVEFAKLLGLDIVEN